MLIAGAGRLANSGLSSRVRIDEVSRRAERAPGGPLGLDFNAFLPRSASKGDAATSAEDEFEAMEGMMRKHATVCGILSVRLGTLGEVAACSARQDMRGAVNALRCNPLPANDNKAPRSGLEARGQHAALN